MNRSASLSVRPASRLLGGSLGLLLSLAASCSSSPARDPDPGVNDGGESNGGGSGDGGSGGGGAGSGAEPSMPTEPPGDPCSDTSDCTDPKEPFCSASGTCVSCDKMEDPDAACAEANAVRPICGENSECRACEEHSECASACHLAGSNRGACFEMEDVQEVATGAALQAALDGLSGSDQAVLVLTGTDYAAVQAEVLNGVEVAIIGDGSAQITGNTGSGLLSVAGNAILYIAGVTVRANDSGHGVACSGTSVWIDDARLENNTHAGLQLSAGCEANLRRAVVRANRGGGVVVNNASLRARTSAISRNFDGGPGIQAINATVELTYCTLAGNNHLGGPDSMECLSSSGFVRNSIITGAAAESVSNCAGLAWESNAVDTAGLGDDDELVGSYQPSWFLDPNAGNFRLSSEGATLLGGVAQWGPGDPAFDVDGSPILADERSFPGYHQPE